METGGQDARAGRGAARAAVGSAALGVVHAALLAGRAGPVDDDYIVWRYARNWVDCELYAFNLADGPTDGVTSPLWFLVCAAAHRLGVTPEVATPVLGVLAFVALAFVASRAAAALAPAGSAAAPVAWCGGLLVACNPAVCWHAFAGLGTVPAALFVGLGVLGVAGGRERAGGAALAVATGFRPECAAVALAMATAAPGARAALWRAGPAALAVLAACAWRWTAFGHALPATGAVKALPIAHELRYGGAYLARSAAEGALAILLAAAGLSAAAGGRARGAAAVARGALAGLAVTLLVGGDWMVFGRFLVPYAALGAVGVSALVAAAAARGRSSRAWIPVAGTVALVLAGALRYPGAIRERDGFERWWLVVGDALAERTEGRPSVATSPIGAIGWRSDLPIVDVLGLTHDAFVDVPPDLDAVKVKGHHRFDGSWVLDREPDYLILGNGILRDGPRPVEINPWEADIVADPRFELEYARELVELRRPDGSRQVLPYARRLAAAPL